MNRSPFFPSLSLHPPLCVAPGSCFFPFWPIVSLSVLSKPAFFFFGKGAMETVRLPFAHRWATFFFPPLSVLFSVWRCAESGRQTFSFFFFVTTVILPTTLVRPLTIEEGRVK